MARDAAGGVGAAEERGGAIEMSGPQRIVQGAEGGI
jgi:hypothetical protein